MLDYAQCREEERTVISVIAVLISVAVGLVGLLAAAITQTCEFNNHSSCVQVPDYILGTAPLLPFALLAFMQMLGSVSILRSFYMRAVEDELRLYIDAPMKSLGSLKPASYTGLITDTISIRHGRASYQIFAGFMLGVVILVIDGLTAYIALHVSTPVMAAMAVFYGIATAFVIFETLNSNIRGRTLFVRTARRYLAGKTSVDLLIAANGQSTTAADKDRKLVSYLLLPRTAEWIKWLFAPAFFVAAAWSGLGTLQWQKFLLAWFVLEYLIYQARYQWNDVRGAVSERGHPYRAERGRLPVTGNNIDLRRNIRVSLIVAAVRVALALCIAVFTHSFVDIGILAAAVFSIAALYELLRSVEARVLRARKLVAISIWLVAGCGYAVRAGVGIAYAGINIASYAAILGMAGAAFFGVMFITLTWMLEGQAFQGNYGKNSSAYLKGKPHIGVLFEFGPAGRTSDAAARRKGRVGNKDLYAPWNVSLVLSVVIGTLFGLGLADPGAGDWYRIGIAGVSLIGALALGMSGTARRQMVVILVEACALIGYTLSIRLSVLATLVVAPWLAISLDYTALTSSTYSDLVLFGRRLLSLLLGGSRHIERSLLRAVVGSQVWQQAGFDAAPVGADVSHPNRS